MKSFFARLTTLSLVLALVVGSSSSQDLQKQLEQFGSANAPLYLKPLLAGFGDGLNTAFYHSADLHDILGFDVGVKIGLGQVQDADKSFTMTLPDNIVYMYQPPGAPSQLPFVYSKSSNEYDPTIVTSTAVGAKEGGVVYSKVAKTVGPYTVPANTAIFRAPGGFDLPLVGVPFMPQAAIGLPFGLEVIGRFIPTINAGDVGKFSYTGFGLRYDVDQWLPLFPIDIAVHFATQSMTFKAGDPETEIFTTSATAYGVEASKRFLFITLYAGFQLESSTASVASYSYRFTDLFGNQQTATIPGFDIEGNNSSRVTFGVRMLLLILNVHAEYSLASTPYLGLGAGLSIR